jgi:PAS domain S-box-containing protein
MRERIMKKILTLRKVLASYFIIVAILPLVIVGAISLQIFSRSMEKEISTRNLQLARALAENVNQFLDETLGMLALVNERYALPRKKGEAQQPEEFLLLLERHIGALERIELVDGRGRIRHAAPALSEKAERSLSGQPFFEEAMSTGGQVFSETFISPVTGFPTIAVALPGKGMAIVGYLDLAALGALVDKAIAGAGNGSRAAIFDRLGYAIAHPDRRLVAQRVNKKDIEPLRRALRGEPGTFPYLLENMKWTGSTAIVGRTGWVVMVCQSPEDVFAEFSGMKQSLMASVFVIVLLSLLTAVIALKKPLRSLAGLVAAARKIAAGDYRIETLPPGYPEIDLLSGAFNGMVEEIANRENALLKTEKRYRNLVEGSFDGIFVHDNKKIIFASQRFCEMFGYEEKELISMDPWLIIAPEYRGLARSYGQARMGGKSAPSRYELKLLRRDGSTLPVEISARRVEVEGEPVIQIWVRDISEEKQAAEQREFSEQRFGELYNSVSDIILTQDIHGYFISANRAACDTFNIKEDELRKFKASDFMKPELAPLFETEYLGKLKTDGHYQGVTAYLTKDKRKVYLDYRSVLVRPPQGEPFISAIARDVTERVLTERALREREGNIRAILEAAPNPIVVYDTKGDVLFINPAFTGLFGWTLEELNGRQIPFVPEDQKERTAKVIRELYQKKEVGPITMETTRLTKDAVTIDIFVSAALIIGPGEKPVGMVVSSTDITQKKKMEAILLHAQKMEAIGALAGGIAHDFNNLLMGIQGNVSLALSNADVVGAVRKNLEGIDLLVNRGASLTRQLLGFARGGKYEVKVYDINEILEAEADLFGGTKKEIVVLKELRPDLWKVKLDRSQMEQVFMNLFVNAGQAMPEGGALHLRTENIFIDDEFSKPLDVNPGRYVKISVTDTGSGMDEETKKRIFEPFFTTKASGQGTGLGLASAYGIIKNHGGFITVYSESGKGASFYIHLPASDSDIVEKTSAPLIEGGLIKGMGTILLVDDEEVIREVGQEMLEMMGYRVIAVGSGKEAIEKFAAVKDGTGEVSKIDVVVQDMIMPGMGGGEVFDRLKELDPHIKVLLSSGYSMNGQAREILARGCAGFMQKPFTMEELSRKVAQVMRG